MNNLRLIIDIVNPDVHILERLNEKLLIFTPNKKAILEGEKKLNSGLPISEVTDFLESDITEVAYISISEYKDDIKIKSFRSITSQYELYYFVSKNQFLISDHFINILSHVPQKQESLSSIVDMFLFQRNSGRETYIKSIKRICHGELLQWSITGDIKITIHQKLDISSHTLPIENEVELINSTMMECIDTLANLDDTANTLSGGLDSTLIHSYLGSSVPSISIAFDFPEYQSDIKYAKEASKLLSTQHSFIKVKRSEYLKELEESVEALGLPAVDLVNSIVMHKLSIDGKQSRFVTGRLADAIFGSSFMEKALHEKNNKATRGQLEKSIYDINGFASLNSLIASKEDRSLIFKIFGEEIVSERLLYRIEYTKNRLNTEIQLEDSVYRHMEFGSLIDIFTNNMISVWRQLASTKQKSVLSPFSSKKLIENSFKIDVSGRYYSEREGLKCILKRILRERVPSYPVNVKKLSGVLPRTKFIQQGPLKNYFGENEIPEFINSEFHKLIREANWNTSWIVFFCISYDIWKRKVLKATNLKRNKNSFYYER